MEVRRLGSSDLDLTVLGLGAWLIGAQMWHEVQDAESIRAIQASLDAGINWIDTAEGYGSGHSERVIAQALAGRREEVILATKVWSANLRRPDLFKALEGSLQNLATDYIDLYQIHWPNAEIPLEETMGALVEAQQQGKIRHIGVSNFNCEQMAEALQYGPIVSLQPCYSLFWRYVEPRIVPFCVEHSIGIIPYSPLAQGLLTGKFTPETRPATDDNRSYNLMFRDPVYPVALEQVEVVREVSVRYGKTPAQVALRWMLQQPGITSAIVGARNERQVADNVGAEGWELAAEDVAVLSAAGDAVMAALPPEEGTVMWKWS